MMVIIDNDVVKKLAKWDLLDELVQLLGGNMDYIYLLPSCYYALCYPEKPSKGIRRCGDQATIDRIKAFCKNSKVLPKPTQDEWLTELIKIPGIDPGEVLIFITGYEKPKSLTYIGDKRSLIALTGAAIVKTIHDSLLGRIKCLEQTMAELICCHGLSRILEKVRRRKDADIVIAIVFGSDPDPRSLQEIWEGLLSYYNTLYHDTAGLLAPFPELPTLDRPRRVP